MTELQNEMKTILEDGKKNGKLSADQEIRLDAIKAELDRANVEARSAAASASIKPVAAKDSNAILRSISKGSAEVNDVTFVNDVVRQFELTSPLFASHGNIQKRSNGMTYHFTKVTSGGAGYVKTEGVAGTDDSASAVAIGSVDFSTYSGQKILVTQEAFDDYAVDLMQELTTVGMAKTSVAFGSACVSALQGAFSSTYTSTATTSWAVTDLINAYYTLPVRHLGNVKYLVNRATAAKLVNLFDHEDAKKLETIGFDKGSILIDDAMATDRLIVTNPTIALAVAMKVPVRVVKLEVSEGYTLEVQPRLAVALRDSSAVAQRKLSGT